MSVKMKKKDKPNKPIFYMYKLYIHRKILNNFFLIKKKKKVRVNEKYKYWYLWYDNLSVLNKKRN